MPAPAPGTGYTCSAVSWNPSNNPFQPNTTYTASVTVTRTSTNYEFASPLTTKTINGSTATETTINADSVRLSRSTTTGNISLNFGGATTIGYPHYTGATAITPIIDGTYNEYKATFTVTVSGFISDAAANSVGLSIQDIDAAGNGTGTLAGFSITGHNATGNASSGTKSFTVTVTYNGSAGFSSGSAVFNITGTTNTPSGYNSPGTASRTVNIRDGQADSANRAVPVSTNNILHFNAYAADL